MSKQSDDAAEGLGKTQRNKKTPKKTKRITAGNQVFMIYAVGFWSFQVENVNAKYNRQLMQILPLVRKFTNTK